MYFDDIRQNNFYSKVFCNQMIYCLGGAPLLNWTVKGIWEHFYAQGVLLDYIEEPYGTFLSICNWNLARNARAKLNLLTGNKGKSKPFLRIKGNGCAGRGTSRTRKFPALPLPSDSISRGITAHLHHKHDTACQL